MDLTTFNQNRWFPVVSSLIYPTSKKTFRVEVTLLDGVHNPTWATHGTRSFSLFCQWITNGHGWGHISIERVIEIFAFAWTQEGKSPLLNISQSGTDSREIFYLRGGAKYYVFTDQDISVEVFENGWTNNTNTQFNPIDYNESLVPKSFKNTIAENTTKITKVENKTDFLSETRIDGNILATGTVVLGNENGANTGITGIGSDKDVSFYSGSDFANRNKAPFRVTRDGRFFATKAKIEGEIQAHRGRIGGFKVDGAFSYSSAHDFLSSDKSPDSWLPDTNYTSISPTLAVFRQNGRQRGEYYKDVMIGQTVPSYTGLYGACLAVNNQMSEYRQDNVGVRIFTKNAGTGGRNIAIHSVGNSVFFEDGYTGATYYDAIVNNFAKTHVYIFTTRAGNGNVRLPKASEIREKVGRDVTFELSIICARSYGDVRMRIEGSEDGYLLDNNGNRHNGGVGYIDMSLGDVLKVRNYGQDWYIMSFRG